MKKFFVVMLIASAASLSAEVTVGGLVDMAVVPFQYIRNKDTDPARPGLPGQEGTVIGAGAGRFESGQGPRARLDLRASYNDVIGMRARIQARTDGIGIEDYLQAWWRPADWLRLDAGRFFEDKLRGKFNDMDERMNDYTVRMYDADSIFSRFRTHRYGGQAGIMLSLTPVENLYLSALLYDLLPFTVSAGPGVIFDAHPQYAANNDDAFRNIQAAAAWTVPDTALFRVQYLGAKQQVAISRITDETALLPYTYNFYTFSITAPRFEAAAAYTGIPGLTVDIGCKIPLPFKDWTRSVTDIFIVEDEADITDTAYLSYKNNHIWQAPYQAALGAKYVFNDIEIAGKADAKFGGSMKGTKSEMYFPFEVNVHLWPSYNLGFATVILDFGYEYIGPTLDENKKVVQDGEPMALNGGSRIGLGISIQKNFFAGSLLKGGVAFKLPGTVNSVDEKMVISIPLFVDFTF